MNSTYPVNTKLIPWHTQSNPLQQYTIHVVTNRNRSGSSISKHSSELKRSSGCNNHNSSGRFPSCSSSNWNNWNCSSRLQSGSSCSCTKSISSTCSNDTYFNKNVKWWHWYEGDDASDELAEDEHMGDYNNYNNEPLPSCWQYDILNGGNYPSTVSNLEGVMIYSAWYWILTLILFKGKNQILLPVTSSSIVEVDITINVFYSDFF